MRRYRALILVTAVACGGQAARTTPNPDREVRVLEKDDPALRRISFAAADYLKDITPGTDVGFSGVYHKRELDVELTREIAISHAFVDVSRGGGASASGGCTGVSRAPNAPPAPSDPARPGQARPATRTTTTDNRACASSGRATYGFTKFRVAADSAFVETTGMPQGLTCLTLAVKPEGGWKVINAKPTRPEACGK